MIYNSFYSQGIAYQGTVRQMADHVRLWAVNVMSEAEFARACLDFNNRLAPEHSENPQARYDELLRQLAANLDPHRLQFGALWLAAHGWGDMSIEQLGLEIRRVALA